MLFSHFANDILVLFLPFSHILFVHKDWDIAKYTHNLCLKFRRKPICEVYQVYQDGIIVAKDEKQNNKVKIMIRTSIKGPRLKSTSVAVET